MPKPTLIRELLLTALLAAGTAAEPLFRPDGSVLIGPLRLAMTSAGEILVTGTGGATGFHLAITRKSDNRWLSTANLEGSKLEIDAAQRSVTMRGVVPMADGAPGVPLAWSFAVRPDGAIRLGVRAEDGRPLSDLGRVAISFHGQRDQHVGRAVEVDGQALTIPSLEVTADRVVPLWNGVPARIEFVSGVPGRFVFLPHDLARVEVVDRHLTSRPGGGVVDISGVVSGSAGFVDIHLAALSAESLSEVIAGVDFGNLRMPRPTGSNLMRNPSFEQGFRYWDKLSLGVMAKGGDVDAYALIETEAHSGRRCLELRARPGVQPVHLAGFAIPVEAGKPYVFSFWARSEPAGGVLEVSSHTALWPKFDCAKTLRPGSTWTRYEIPFTTSNSVIGIGFAPGAGSAEGTRLLIDAVQLEPGTVATAYTEPPVAVVLTSAARGNLLAPGEPVAATLRIDGRPGLTGSVAITATTLDGTLLKQETLPFALGPQGTCQLPLAWAETLARGLTIFETQVTTADGTFSDRDHHRIAIMPWPDPQRRHRLLFAGGAFDSRFGNWTRWAAFFRRAGIGSHVMFDPAPEEMRATFANAGVYFYSAIYDGGEAVVLNGQKLDLRHHYAELTPAQLTAIESFCYHKALANPTIRHWKTFNEMDAVGGQIQLLTGPDHESRMRAFIALQRAAYQGIKRADPTLQVLSPDCCNMYPSGGIAFLDAYFAAGGAAITDMPAIHPYRQRPEDPDLDAHIAAFIAMVTRHGFTGDIWFTEGIYHFGVHVPAFATNPHAGCSTDPYRAPPLSYHCAWGERIAAAYTMRSWLAALKYSDRVRHSVDWGFPRSQRTLDHDFTPSAIVFASNTLADLLGDAVFLRDLEYGKGVRGYVFDDGHGATVAALWSYDAKRDRGEGVAPVLHLPGLPAGTERIACDGAIGVASADLPLQPEPVFLRSRDRAALIAALEAGSFPAGGVINTSTGIRVVSTSLAEAEVRNLLGRSQRGRLTVASGGVTLTDRAIELAPRAALTLPLPLAMADGVLSPISASITFIPAGSHAATPTTAAFDAFLIHRTAQAPLIDGDLGDWPAATRIAVPHRLVEYPPPKTPEYQRFSEPVPWQNPDDLSATLHAAWDEQRLYLALAVRDQDHDPLDDPARSYQGDGVQLYLDTWGDARQRNSGGYGNDDQAFRIWQRADGSLAVLRDTAPEQQVAFLKTGLVAGVEGVVRRVNGTTTYELALPLKELQPMPLKTGAVIGLALLINDRDRDWRKRALTMTAPGTEPHQHPERFPAAILVE